MTRCQQVDALRGGRIQIGIVFLPIDGGGLTVAPLCREPLVAVLPEDHRCARRERVRLLDLQGDAMISFPRAARGRDHMTLSACRQAGFEPRMAYATDRIETNLGLVAAGLGVSLLPASIRNLRRAGVVYRPLVPPAPHLEMAAAYPRDTVSPGVTTFLRVLREATGRARRGRAGRAKTALAAGGDPPEPASSRSA
jgi:DNA-binding transcriptional LysR family regulator